MKDIPPIKTVMTPFPQTIEAGEKAHRAGALMGEHRIHHLPVTESGDLIGILGREAVDRALDPGRGLPPDPDTAVREICDLEPLRVELTDPLDGVLSEMAQRRLDAALVVKEGRLVGIFTANDACRRFSEFLRRLFPKGDPEGIA